MKPHGSSTHTLNDFSTFCLIIKNSLAIFFIQFIL
nr:MAG TPA: hypothetical protein [Caudoviricetes sp.]